MSGTGGEDDDKQGAGQPVSGKPEGAEIIAGPWREAASAEAGTPAGPDVRRAPHPAGPDATEALIVKTLASVTGRDPSDLLRELREGRVGDEEDDAGKVVDLGAVREARRREEAEAAAGGGSLWGPVLKSGMQALFEGFARHAPPSGELVIDAAFMKTHGLSLLGEVLSSVGSSLLGASPAGPASGASQASGPAEAGPTVAPAAEPSEPEVAAKVEVQMDFGSLASALLGGIFGGRRAEPPAAPSSGFAPDPAAPSEGPPGADPTASSSGFAPGSAAPSEPPAE
jgi:hypothetical protein